MGKILAAMVHNGVVPFYELLFQVQQEWVGTDVTKIAPLKDNPAWKLYTRVVSIKLPFQKLALASFRNIRFDIFVFFKYIYLYNFDHIFKNSHFKLGVFEY